MNLDCPKCNGRLQSTKLEVEASSKDKDLQGADLEYELEMNQCFVCGGVWFDKGELETYLRRGLTTLKSPSLGTQMDKQLNSKKGNCPVCKIEMAQHPDSHDQGIQVDTCPQCGGIWLDSTEIDRLEAEEWKMHPKKSLLAYAMNAVLTSRRNRSGADSDSE